MIASALAAAEVNSPPKPNILLIMIDTLRADHTSAYGYAHSTTPTLEQLSAQGVRFEQAYSPASTTGPSVVSLFTSLYPITHGYLRNGLPLKESFYTLAEHLNDAGYQTYGIASSLPLAVPGMSQGFEDYDAELPRPESSPIRTYPEGLSGKRINRPIQLIHNSPDGHVGYDRRPQFTTDRTLAWFHQRRDESRPYFAFIHYIDPHEPYTPPEEQLGLFTAPSQDLPLPEYNLANYIRDYDAETRHTDDEFRRLIDRLDVDSQLDNTLIIVTADHGQGLYQHGIPGHGQHLYEEQVRIPWIMVWPGQLPENHTVAPPVSLLDVMPTILELAGIATGNGGGHGRSLVRAVKKQGNLDAEFAVFLQEGTENTPDATPDFLSTSPRKYAVRVGPFKYIETPETQIRELYDLRTDPLETTNLADSNPDKTDELSRRLEVWRNEFGRPLDQEDLTVSPELVEGLRALGYVD